MRALAFGVTRRLLGVIEEVWLPFGWRRDSATTRRREAELGRDTHHDLGLPVGDRNVGRLNRIAGRRLDHGAVFLDRLGRLSPHAIGEAVGRQRCAIEVGQEAERGQFPDEPAPFALSDRSEFRRALRNGALRARLVHI
jgi:hypothetical protein